MATKEMKVCDVFGTCDKVNTYLLTLKPVERDSEDEPVAGSWNVDLCSRGLVRLSKFIERGVAPPRTKA